MFCDLSVRCTIVDVPYRYRFSSSATVLNRKSGGNWFGDVRTYSLSVQIWDFWETQKSGISTGKTEKLGRWFYCTTTCVCSSDRIRNSTLVNHSSTRYQVASY